jgi:hypothetical protein
MEPIFASIAQTKSILGVGHTKLYQLVNRGELDLVHLDGKSLITTESIRRLAAKLIEKAAA